ncbi:MAG: hypothetical protein IPJ20_04800, partial [Flammeovirgaceae bacterium]|nr:hypothetical protein [Flammeovirgaceae bacterium]
AKVVPSYSNPRLHRHGTLISWAYWDYGVIGFVPEFWGKFPADENKDGKVTDEELIKWNDDKLEGKYFINWQAYNHPQLGQVEIGGWNQRFIKQNPPPSFLKAEIELYVPWMLWLAETSPRVVIKDASVKWIDKSLAKITVKVENEGFLPTNISKRAIEANIASPVRALIELKDAELVSGKPRTDLGHLTGRRDGNNLTSMAEVEYIVKVSGSDPVVTITTQSEKGGKSKQELKLKK